ncbi:MAG: Flp pilus assembly protein CpaB [Candidatus Omnitrophica bacterium]|nr:Flp pilus assembly protein CpaB [Candidatus Omnitrophota bacterium]
MTKRAGMLVLAVALFSGLICSATVMKYVNQVSETTVAPVETTPVLVTKVSVPAGGSILNSQVELVQRPVDSIPEGAIRTLEQGEGRVVRTTLYPGEMVMEERLIKRGSMGGLPSLIPKGMRAITLKVDDTISVSGFVRPGHFVDVLTTVDIDDSLGGTITKTILQSVQVVATGREIENVEGEENTKLVPTVTVLVTLDQAERLALATNAGSIRLVLRNHEDLNETPTEGVTLSSLIPQSKRHVELPMPVLVEEEIETEPEPAPPAPQFHVVEVYRGTQRSEVALQE